MTKETTDATDADRRDWSALSDLLGLQPKRAGILVRLFARLRGGVPVWLRDFQGEIYCSIAIADKFGSVTAPVYWYINVGNCVLLPGGKVCRKSASSYVHDWVKA